MSAGIHFCLPLEALGGLQGNLKFEFGDDWMDCRA